MAQCCLAASTVAWMRGHSRALVISAYGEVVSVHHVYCSEVN